jgi:hypothetical protein
VCDAPSLLRWQSARSALVESDPGFQRRVVTLGSHASPGNPRTLTSGDFNEDRRPGGHSLTARCVVSPLTGAAVFVIRFVGAHRRNGELVGFWIDGEFSGITWHDLDAFKLAQRSARPATCTDSKGRTYATTRGGMVSANRCLGRLRAFFSWAVDHDHVPASPFRKGGVAKVKLFGESERERRLFPGEEVALLKAANPHLAALITAALETSCRLGELLRMSVPEEARRD